MISLGETDQLKELSDSVNELETMHIDNTRKYRYHMHSQNITFWIITFTLTAIFGIFCFAKLTKCNRSERHYPIEPIRMSTLQEREPSIKHDTLV